MKSYFFILIPLLIWFLIGTHLWSYYQGVETGKNNAYTNFHYPSEDTVKAYVRGYLKDNNTDKKQVLFWNFNFDSKTGWVSVKYDFYPSQNLKQGAKLRICPADISKSNSYGLVVCNEVRE